MASTRFLPTLILRYAQVVLWLLLISSGVMLLTLAERAYDVASAKNTEVRLRLDTSRPNSFEFWHSVATGFRGGQRGRTREQRGVLPALLPTADFELAADPHVPLLRYREPSDGKRAALLALGALDDSLSVASLVFLAGSCWLLLRLLRDVVAGNAFTQANARWLHQLTLLVLGVNLWKCAAYALVWALVPAYRVAALVWPLSHYVRLATDDLVPGFGVVLILSIIAAVYRRGVELSREAELVI